MSDRFGDYLIEKGILSTGGLIALILYVERLVFPTALLGFTLNTFQLGQVSLERVEELLNKTPSIKDEPKSKLLRYVKSSLDLFGIWLPKVSDKKQLNNIIIKKFNILL